MQESSKSQANALDYVEWQSTALLLIDCLTEITNKFREFVELNKKPKKDLEVIIESPSDLICDKSKLEMINKMRQSLQKYTKKTSLSNNEIEAPSSDDENSEGCRIILSKTLAELGIKSAGSRQLQAKKTLSSRALELVGQSSSDKENDVIYIKGGKSPIKGLASLQKGGLSPKNIASIKKGGISPKGGQSPYKASQFKEQNDQMQASILQQQQKQSGKDKFKVEDYGLDEPKVLERAKSAFSELLENEFEFKHQELEKQISEELPQSNIFHSSRKSQIEKKKKFNKILWKDRLSQNPQQAEGQDLNISSQEREEEEMKLKKEKDRQIREDMLKLNKQFEEDKEKDNINYFPTFQEQLSKIEENKEENQIQSNKPSDSEGSQENSNEIDTQQSNHIRRFEMNKYSIDISKIKLCENHQQSPCQENASESHKNSIDIKIQEQSPLETNVSGLKTLNGTEKRGRKGRMRLSILQPKQYEQLQNTFHTLGEDQIEILQPPPFTLSDQEKIEEPPENKEEKQPIQIQEFQKQLEENRRASFDIQSNGDPFTPKQMTISLNGERVIRSNKNQLSIIALAEPQSSQTISIAFNPQENEFGSLTSIDDNKIDFKDDQSPFPTKVMNFASALEPESSSIELYFVILADFISFKIPEISFQCTKDAAAFLSQNIQYAQILSSSIIIMLDRLDDFFSHSPPDLTEARKVFDFGIVDSIELLREVFNIERLENKEEHEEMVASGMALLYKIIMYSKILKKELNIGENQIHKKQAEEAMFTLLLDILKVFSQKRVLFRSIFVCFLKEFFSEQVADLYVDVTLKRILQVIRTLAENEQSKSGKIALDLMIQVHSLINIKYNTEYQTFWVRQLNQQENPIWYDASQVYIAMATSLLSQNLFVDQILSMTLSFFKHDQKQAEKSVFKSDQDMMLYLDHDKTMLLFVLKSFALDERKLQMEQLIEIGELVHEFSQRKSSQHIEKEELLEKFSAQSFSQFCLEALFQISNFVPVSSEIRRKNSLAFLPFFISRAVSIFEKFIATIDVNPNTKPFQVKEIQIKQFIHFLENMEQLTIPPNTFKDFQTNKTYSSLQYQIKRVDNPFFNNSKGHIGYLMPQILDCIGCNISEIRVVIKRIIKSFHQTIGVSPETK